MGENKVMHYIRPTTATVHGGLIQHRPGGNYGWRETRLKQCTWSLFLHTHWELERFSVWVHPGSRRILYLTPFDTIVLVAGTVTMTPVEILLLFFLLDVQREKVKLRIPFRM